MNDEPTTIGKDYLAELERVLIEQFLHARGYTMSTLHELSEDTAAALLKEASVYASGRLTEVESRAHFISDLHDAGHPEPSHPRERAG